MPHMINSLNKLGLHGSASSETRDLSISLMQTIYDWEQKAAEQKRELESKVAELKADVDKKSEPRARKQEEKTQIAEEMTMSEQGPAVFSRTPLACRENVVS